MPAPTPPETIPVTESGQRLSPDLILVAKETSTAQDAPIPGFDTEKKSFGFSWFLPELKKHKTIWRDVLLASLAIQLVGLVTPLFTQVLLDKVIPHQTHSTLIVLGVALVMFMLFTAGMTWLRQYLVLHTGTLVARLHGVETIREFVSGAAVTLILDCPFLLIFLAVMFAYSWQLSLIAVGLLGTVALISVLVAPVFREKLNRQFMLGARNQSFLTEYIAGMGTVKALQMEPDIDRKYGDLLASYLAAGFSTKQTGNTYHVIANALEQVMTLSILIVGALLVMQNDGFTVGMLVAFQMFAGRMSQPMLRLVGLWQEFQQAIIAVKRLGDTLPHYQAQDAAFAKLAKDGYAGPLMASDKKRERIEKEQELRNQAHLIESNRAYVTQSERRLAQIDSDYRRQLHAERNDIHGQAEKLAQERAKQTHRQGLQELRGSQDSVVKDLATHTVGTVVQPGTVLLTLVPQDDTLRAEVWVSNEDIGFVRPGQPVKLKFAAFPFQKYGMVDGTVEHVSADSADGASGNGTAPGDKGGAKNQPLLYKALVTLQRMDLEMDGRRFALSAGMQSNAEIRLGTRTVMEYLLSPVRKAWHEAGRER